jgi:hypothetical protein
MLAMNYMYVINTALRVCVHELIVWLAVFFILWMASLSSAHFLVCHDAVLPFILNNLSMACVLYIRCSYLATYQWLVCYILDVSIDLICTLLLAGLSRRSLLNWSNDRTKCSINLASSSSLFRIVGHLMSQIFCRNITCQFCTGLCRCLATQ